MEAESKNGIAVVLSSNTIDNIHVLPCTTAYNGEAKVRQYFQNPIRKETDCLKTSLHGRDMKGVEIAPIEGNILYYGQRNDNRQNRKLILQRVCHLTQWTKDLPRQPKQSQLLHLQQWLVIQQSLHVID